jgi:tol-pal system protein YbgF
MRTKLFVGGLLLILAAGPVYSQNKDILRLQADMVDVQQRIKQLQSSIDENNAATKGLIEKTADQVNTLAGAQQKIIDAVAGSKGQNDATAKEMRTILTNLNTAIGDLQESLTSIRGQISSLSQQVTTLKTTSEPLAGPNDLLKNATSEFFSGLYDLAIGDYQDFLSKYPKDPHAPDAHVRLGDSYFNLKKYEPAEAEFDFVLQNYPDSDTSRAALLKKGLSQAEHDPTQAKTTLGEVVKKYPNTSEASTAQEKLKQLQPSSPAKRPPAR